MQHPFFSVGGAAFSAILFCAVASAQTQTARVVGIVDGDTIDVLAPNHQQREIRLEGIDAPKEGQPFAHESLRHLRELVFSKDVSLNCNDGMTYSRFVCKVTLPNAEDVNLDQIKSGMAWHYREFQRLETAADRAAYGAAEAAARHAHLGLWSDPHPVEPEDYRHRARGTVPLKMLMTELLAAMRTRGQ